MEQIQLAGSDLACSRISLGTWAIGGAEIDRILKQTIRDPASPAFMAPPVVRPVGIDEAVQAIAEPVLAK